MKFIIFFALIFAINSCAFGQDKMYNNIDNSNIALQGYSAVSYAELGIAQKGMKAYQSEYEKISYYFTSAEQKEKFDENPSAYLPQYGGYCAFGIYAGAKFRTDPNKFISKDGKYFLFLYNLELDAQQLWLDEKAHEKLVEQADKNWLNLNNTYN